ncbi:MAG: tetratricopeptide repeat protein [Saprospiraceae bacterium]|nr:tetratricopeptide repeat protein [Saprospiraceae bacterium]MBP7699001.1 tetratricopeptide repeat protein [Saprospiraceae bacterium]
MTKSQLLTITLAVIAFIGLYTFGSTKPKGQALIERTRSLSLVSTDATSLIIDAKKKLSADKIAWLDVTDKALTNAQQDSTKATILQKLSAQWFEWGNAPIAGYYAQQVAEIRKTEEAWSIAGTTFTIALQKTAEEKVRQYSSDNAIKSFENAISLNPQNTNNRINLALCYAENPPKDNPMKGILMLIDLNKKYPDNVSVLVQLGKLGIKTGQYEKAIERLKKAVALDPKNTTAYCYLAEAYKGFGDTLQADAAAKNCK